MDGRRGPGVSIECAQQDKAGSRSGYESLVKPTVPFINHNLNL